MIKNKFIFIISTVILMFTFASCSQDLELLEDPAQLEKISSQKLFKLAEDNMKKNNFNTAKKAYNALLLYHPDSTMSAKALIRKSYILYKQKDYIKADLSFRRFIRVYPGNVDTPYAYYMIAQIYYEQINNSTRDQSFTLEAKKAFNEVLKRYPHSKYALQAKLKLDLTDDFLANNILQVAVFYKQQHNCIAAIPRLQSIILTYKSSRFLPETLYNLYECQLFMGLNEEAVKTLYILKYNYMTNDWYQKALTLSKQKLEPATPDQPWYNFVSDDEEQYQLSKIKPKEKTEEKDKTKSNESESKDAKKNENN